MTPCCCYHCTRRRKPGQPTAHDVGYPFWPSQRTPPPAPPRVEPGLWIPSLAAAGLSRTAGGRVYFVATFDERFVKIGFSTDVAQRVRALNAANPEPLNLLGSVPGTPADERAWHIRLAAHRAGGEWFRLAPAVQAAILETFRTDREGAA